MAEDNTFLSSCACKSCSRRLSQEACDVDTQRVLLMNFPPDQLALHRNVPSCKSFWCSISIISAFPHNMMAAGGNMPERISPGFVAQIGNLKRDEALQALSRTHALRQPVLNAVYSYWREKRVSRGRPLLRRLQAPTPQSDSNPFNVFR